MVDGVQKTHHVSQLFIFSVSAIGCKLKLYFFIIILCDDPLHKHSGPSKGCWTTLFEIVSFFGHTAVFICVTSLRTYL